MITCVTCKKFAKLERTIINGLDEFILIGSCKYCGYKNQPSLPKDFDGKMIRKLKRKEKITFDDWEELGIDR